MDEEMLRGLIGAREGQTVEFKTSLADMDDGTQTAVAFANAQGGHVLFGVEDSGTVLGIDIGANTLENTANSMNAHAYPSLPMVLEAIEIAGKTVVAAVVPRDVPPIVGVYMYSSSPIEPTKRVDAASLRAFRRVGRTDQQVDFMVLREPLQTDPRIRLTTFQYDFSDATDQSLFLKCRIWIEEGSGSAHAVSIESEPRIGNAGRGFDDFPYPRSSSAQGRWLEVIAPFDITAPALIEEPIETFRLIADYKDDWGLGWQSVREMHVNRMEAATGRDVIESIVSGAFQRRITSLPAKIARAQS